MNIQTALQCIYAAALADDTVIMEGPHGIGKSQIVEQFADESNYHLETLFLSHQEVGDLIGIPHIMKDPVSGESITYWSTPVWLQRMNEAAALGKKCVIFLDELNRAPIDVRQSALQLVLERQIHEHSLPTVDGVRTLVVAAINPSDGYQVDELDPALLDRFLHIIISPDAEAWVNWARKKGVNQVVRDFIMDFPDRIHVTPADGGIGCTPRSWTKLGGYLDNKSSIPPEILIQVIMGKVGKEVGSQFYSFMKNYVDVVKVKDIEDIVNENRDKLTDIESLADLIAEKTAKTESIQKNDLAHQLEAKYMTQDDVLPFLAYLYSLEVEICVSFLKSYRTDNPKGYGRLVKIDEELNNKELFRRVINAADKENKD